MFSSRKVAALTLATAGLSAPATAAADDWYRPAQRDAGTGLGHTIDDARSPDAVDAASQATVDAAPQTTRIVEVPAEGFAVTDAAIGGAATLAIVVLVGAGGMTLVRRRSAAAFHPREGSAR